MKMKTMVIAIGILLGFCAGIHFYAEWQKKAFDASLPKPPVPEQQVADDVTDDAAGGHWHGDEWHAEPHNAHAAEQSVETKIATINRSRALPQTNLSPEEIAELDRSFYESLGLEVPPKGYHYIWDEPEVVARDENGNPILQNDYEPYVEMSTTIGFAPTREQWESYLRLNGALMQAESDGDDNKAQRIRNEIEQLEADAQGELPIPNGTSWLVPEGEDVEAFNNMMHRKVDEVIRQAYRERGLEHLIRQ